jgi:hypothetical protein
MSKTRSRSRSRARSRSSSPHTPRTPSDAFQVSDEDAMLIMPFDCNVIMSSGKSLHSFRCDQHTSMGCVRNGVRQILADMQNKGLLQEFDSFQLLRAVEANRSVLTITIRSMKCLQTSRVRIVC